VKTRRPLVPFRPAVLGLVLGVAWLPGSAPIAWAANAAASLAGKAPAIAPSATRKATTTTQVDCNASPATGRDFHGQTLLTPNFSRQDLRGANFRCATLVGAAFIRSNLNGADFTNAVFTQQAGRVPQTDFSFANLTAASFTNAQFQAPTYFTYATLSSADFSGTDISTPNAIFGDEPLVFDGNAVPRLRFVGATMNCEFVAQWKWMDLSNALAAKPCAAQLKTASFAGAMLSNVDLSGLDLAGTDWAGATLRGTRFENAVLDLATGMNGAAGTDLTGAQFNKASVRYVDFSGGKLYGANFIAADLEGSDFTGAQLMADSSGTGAAAHFDGAHLLNVSFVSAGLNSVSFTYASLYGSAIGVPPRSCTLAKDTCPDAYPATGATCSCATLRGANLTRTDFGNAFLYGVDLSTSATLVNGSKFDGALLVGSNFDAASFSIDRSQGTVAPSFEGAWLHAVRMSAANLDQVSLEFAFVDFGSIDASGNLRTGNALQVLLGSRYTDFPNRVASPGTCIRLRYDDASALPIGIGTMTCPDGNSYGSAPVGCGALQPLDLSSPSAPPPNPRWAGGQPLAANATPGWYQAQPTYGQATTGAGVCGGVPEDRTWFQPKKLR
jgi:uncharacterized protein YjbI with pentapeptide repeats